MITSKDIQIRETNANDFNNIMNVEKQAFGYDKEAKLVAELLVDRTAEPILSLLAFHDDEAVGHILFTRAYFDNQEVQPMMHILAPMAVKPDYQRRGIGGMLIQAGIEKLKAKGSNLLFVLGHKDYYPKYGFIPDAARLGYPAPYPIPEEFSDCWMVQPLSPEGYEVGKGKIRCCEELNKPEHWRDEEADRENKTIHDFDFNLICEFFSLVERQGPGSPEVTIKALSFIDNLTKQPRIADLGCGTGGQTMVLAQHAQGQITGLDLFPDFIDIFNRNAGQLGLQDRVKGIVGSMTEELPFEKESLDLIWSEGAIYNIGFERGLNEWQQYLKKGGYIAVSEASWFTEERPAEIENYWMEHYQEVDTIPNKVAQMQKAGYVPVATFIEPENCWIEHYFAPKVKAYEEFLRKHIGNKTVEDLVAHGRYEEEIYRKYKEFYGYVFYIGKKI